MKIFLRQIPLLIVLFIFSGCAQHTMNFKSSIIEYLYPTSQIYSQPTQVVKLQPPFKIGLAFVPDGNSTKIVLNEKQYALTEKEKLDLLKRVGADFKKYDFIEKVEIIPSSYLKSGGSFENIDQIGALYGIDLILLLSYDQTQFTDEGAASAAYWTLIGAYVVPGEKNDTHTMIEASVFDIKSHKMIFRSSGTSLIKSKATLINLSEQMRKDGAEGFHAASEDLLKNFDTELEYFKAKIKMSIK